FNLYKNQKVDESLYANEAHFFNDLIDSQVNNTLDDTNWFKVSRNYGYIQTDFYRVVHIHSKDMLVEKNNTYTLKANEKLFLSYRWLRKNLQHYFENAIVVWRAEDREIVLILQEEDTDLSEKFLKIAQKIDALINNQLTFSVGYPVSKWDQIEQSYTQAKLAHNERQNKENAESVIFYRDKGADQLFN